MGQRVLEIIEEDRLLDNSITMGDYFYQQLLALQQQYPIIGHVDGGKGVFLAMELVKDPKTKQPASDEAKFLTEYCLENGLLFEYGGYFYNRIQFLPPISVTRQAIDKGLKILEEGLQQIAKIYGG